MNTTPVDQPRDFTIFPDGRIDGASRHYEKALGDLDGLYLDGAAWQAAVDERGAAALAYAVDDQRYTEAEGSLIVGTSTLQPGRFGSEYAMTRGHLHAVANRAELYHCLAGRGVLLMETVDGQSTAIELTPGKAVNVPGHWIHRSVNVGTEPFVTLFCYAADAGQDYGVIGDAGGMRMLVVATGPDDDHGSNDDHGPEGRRGWTTVPNRRHTGYRAATGS